MHVKPYLSYGQMNWEATRERERERERAREDWRERKDEEKDSNVDNAEVHTQNYGHRRHTNEEIPAPVRENRGKEQYCLHTFQHKSSSKFHQAMIYDNWIDKSV